MVLLMLLVAPGFAQAVELAVQSRHPVAELTVELLEFSRKLLNVIGVCVDLSGHAAPPRCLHPRLSLLETGSVFLFTPPRGSHLDQLAVQYILAVYIHERPIV